MAEVRVTARCFPTEDREKVLGAIMQLFPDFVPEGDDPVTGMGDSTGQFAEMLKKQRIRSAARAVLRRGRHGNTIIFYVNKQVATVGKVSFSEERHPLGDIEVRIESEDTDDVIDEIAPMPEGGDPR